MFCPKCGANLPENSAFCSNCGCDLRTVQANNVLDNNIQIEQSNPSQVVSSLNNIEHSMTEEVSKNNKSFFFSKVIKTISKYKKQFFVILAIIIIIIIGLFVYGKYFGFEKLYWDESYLDTKTNVVTQGKLKLGVKFSNKEKINEIKWKSTCGEIKGKGLEITWDLSSVTGQCEITASYKLKSIKRNLSVVPFNLRESDLSFDYKIDENSDEDLDYDGLTNKQEKEYKTDPQVVDTDLDGLEDYYEIFTSKTDPTKKDSDNDGLSDYDEIELGLNPLNADSKNDGVMDGQRELTYNSDSDKVKISIVGNGNIASTVSQVNSNTRISGKNGFIDNLYTLYTEGTIKEATLTIAYTDEELLKYGINEDNLSIYYYNDKELSYEKIDSKVDKLNKTVTAKLKHFSNYLLGDTDLVKRDSRNEVLFILDNSWSMYTNEQYKRITGEEYSGGLFDSSKLDGFDADGVRFSLTSQLVDKLSDKNYQIGLSEFRSDYANALKIGSDTGSIKKKLASMTGNFITTKAGTDIGNALIKGLDEFSRLNSDKYIIILTDGQDSLLKNKTSEIIKKAFDNGVKICSIGFGDASDNSELSNISKLTGCKFFSSSNVGGLTELFENVKNFLVDDLVDIDNDNDIDGIQIADSGFVVNRDGFSFENYVSNLAGGHCYGMALFAELYYKKVLPLKADAKSVGNDTAYAYNLTRTYFKNYNNLYDYKLKTNSLKYLFDYEYFGEQTPSDYYVLNKETLAVNDKYKKEINDLRIYDIDFGKSSLNSEEQLKEYGFKYTNYEKLILNEDRMQTSLTMDNTDLKMFNAIYMAYLSQSVANNYYSSSDFWAWFRNKIGTENVEYMGGTGFISILKSRLNDKDAPVIIGDYSAGKHAVNAINLVQNIDNPNLYYIGVYDNNYPGEKRYISLECNNNACVTKANSYYKNSGKPVGITLSLDDDLAYYNE